MQYSPARSEAAKTVMTRDPAPFVDLEESALRQMVPQGAVRSFPKNAVVLNEGDLTDSLYVILSGRVKVFMSEEDGKEIVLNTIDTGDYFGEIVLDGGPRSASIMTLEPCRFFVIPRADVEGLIEQNPAFARDLIARLIRKVRSLAGFVRTLGFKDVYGRLVSFLEQNAVEQDGRRQVPERLTQQEIAARIGASREMVSRIFKDLSAGGYIEIDNKRIVLRRKLPPNW